MADKPEKKAKDPKPAEGEAKPVKAKKPKSDEKAEAKAEAAAAPPPPPAPKNSPKKIVIPKLAKKNKSRLPRKQKKALQKAANKKG